MVRLQRYAAFSFLAATTVIYHGFKSRQQFYPATLYLSSSKICLMLLLNMGLVLMCSVWQLVKLIFLGSLREAEVERLNEQSWREVMEILFAITIFRQEFSISFLAMVTALLLIKAHHWLAQKRVEHIETSPSVSLRSHVRIISFMGFLLIMDSLFLYNNLQYLIRAWVPSVALFFSFEYMILATTTISMLVKYAFYITDMLMEGQWEKKPVCTFYLELIRDLLHLAMYLFFFLVTFVTYGVPLHLIRDFYETFYNFKTRISDYIRYRKITSNMNERFPDATPEELNASDATCIICREELVTAKKLLCGHLFHVHCLRSWLERQHTCPTCRSLVVPPETASNIAGRQHGFPQENRQSGSITAGASTEASGVSATNGNLGQQQGRLQAAIRAASLYERSYAVQFSPPVTANAQTGVSDGEAVESTRAAPAHGPHQQNQSPFTGGYPFVFMPYSTSGLNEIPSNRPDIQTTMHKAQESLIQHQIEYLKTCLQIIEQQQLDQLKDTS